MDEVEALAHQVVLLHRGRVLAAGTVADVKASVDQARPTRLDAGDEGRTISLEDAVVHIIEDAR
jgi:ABC-type molybdate transport system ATPase subunit